MSATATLERPAARPSVEHFDVLIVGAGISGVGGAYHLTTQCPGQDVCRAGGAGDVRRHLVDTQVSRHPFRQRPAHLRLPLQAVDQRADRHRRRNPHLHERRDRGERPGATYPLPAQDRAGLLVSRRTISGPSRRPGPTPARRFASPPTSCGCARATTATRRATRRNGRAWPTTRAASSIRRPGRRIWTTRARPSWSSAPAPPRRPSCRRWPRTCKHVTMLQRSPTYFRTGAQRHRAGRGAARAGHRGRVDPRDRAPEDPVRAGRVHQAHASASRRR